MAETALELSPVADEATHADEDEAVTETDSDEETVQVMMYPMSQEEAILGFKGHELAAASETESSWPKIAASETEPPGPKPQLHWPSSKS